MRKIHIFRIVSFIFIIVFIIGNINLEDDYVSEIDNRKLMDKSDIKNGTITTNIETYLSDRIGFREEMINSYTLLMDKAFNEMVHPTYQYGKNGEVFIKLNVEEEKLEFQENYSEFILNFQKYCESKDIQFLYAVEPMKQTVYKELLPNGYNFENKNLEYFLQLLKEKKINYIYNGDNLIKAKNHVRVFDKEYDAGHWNETGAIIGISTILEKLNEMNKLVDKFDINKFEVSKTINETLPVSYFKINDETLNYNIINDDNIIKITDYEGKINISERYRTFSHYKNIENEDAPKILVFAGSYFNGKDKFLTESFSEYIKIHNYENVVNYEYYIELFQPDIVLFESTEYTHDYSYFPIKVTE